MASLEEWVEPDFHQVNLDIETHLKNERGYKLDAGEFELNLEASRSPSSLSISCYV
jgi:hypothetical protein